MTFNRLQCPFSVFSTCSPGLISKAIWDLFLLVLNFSFWKKIKSKLQKRLHCSTRSPITVSSTEAFLRSAFCFPKHSKVANVENPHAQCVSPKNTAIFLHSSPHTLTLMKYYLLHNFFFAKLGIGPRALHMLGKYCTTELGHRTSSWVLKKEKLHLSLKSRDNGRNGKVLPESSYNQVLPVCSGKCLEFSLSLYLSEIHKVLWTLSVWQLGALVFHKARVSFACPTTAPPRKQRWSVTWAVVLASGQDSRDRKTGQHNDTMAEPPGFWACLCPRWWQPSTTGEGEVYRHFLRFWRSAVKNEGGGRLWLLLRFGRCWSHAILWVSCVTSDLRQSLAHRGVTPPLEWHPRVVLIVSVSCLLLTKH